MKALGVGLDLWWKRSTPWMLLQLSFHIADVGVGVFGAEAVGSPFEWIAEVRFVV